MNDRPGILCTSEQKRFSRLRWIIYGLLAASFISVFFHRIAPGVVAGELMAAFNTSAVALGSLAAAYYYVYTAMQIPSGILADTLGPRVCVTAGGVLAGLGSLLFALAPDYSTAMAGRLLVGLGVSVVFVAFMKSNTQWFSERSYGVISGLTIFLGNLGGVFAAAPLGLILDVLSWRTVFVLAGIVSLGLAVASAIVVRNRPEDAGFPSIREMEGQLTHPERQQSWLADLRQVLANPRIWAAMLMNVGMLGGLLAFAGLWGVPYLEQVHGISRTQASQYTSMALLGFAISCLGMGFVTDRLGRRKPPIVFSCALSCGVWLALILMPWGPGLSGFVLYTLLGISAGGFVAVFPAAREIVPPWSAGTAMAMVNTGSFLGAAILQPAFGWAMDLGWSGVIIDGVRWYSIEAYQRGLWLCFAFCVFSLLASLGIRETRCRNTSLPENRGPLGKPAGF
ncbi:MFS transporter [Desulfurispirillum indicum]|uniref:Lysosomal dipeptide transporter MFSD1 n=1 Tax=Desulfurispirillum indicum (strain ATCC BAA-1389 / DSM 22839 / S5) TaxID=653733 RepID=E6W4P9_DESIS|nr:MFS transporter [Desulfurispirillum indicum]ADU67122.1 major facilitator superfamily MFS_1 [Desulfurispirillum indicum S5]UCZ56446.1 MFS transporter [Desulfurispirillum indicum]